MAGKCSSTCPMRTEWVKGNAVGSGSFGVVNLAMNRFTGELFVVKSTSTEAGFKSLENEANILESLNSPYIIRCLGQDFSKEANGERKLNLFLEFMAGGSLSNVVEKFGGSLDETVICSYTKEILHGLAYLHRSGIVHCDIKCKNVLLGSSGNIKLADFGCAKRKNSSKLDKVQKSSLESISGTPLWMAPEVLRNEGLDFASDIWSLGCTIIEMATGRPPWGDLLLNPMAAVFQIACSNETPELPTKFSNEGLDFLAKCLQRDQKMRWTCEELLDHPFISGNRRCSCEKDACSPTSVLDDGLYEENYASDESESPHKEELQSRIPFFTRSSSGRYRMARRQHREIDLQSSENWITVRSG
ncbi:mitogen-activated protein kinase kinase kinase 17-like [Macadamia integrifolia]|uniref:mitogen-activated protein kinase kinase kinase 17-like n=1 Tax=Macadamia integrifolia TaxID=60698 RepID=UPI001C4EEFDD|nr:mitogen-activated protein kinase kinase kinase 17-like [Macadamia integrifolia]